LVVGQSKPQMPEASRDYPGMSVDSESNQRNPLCMALVAVRTQSNVNLPMILHSFSAVNMHILFDKSA
jgi:hypothetical protein